MSPKPRTKKMHGTSLSSISPSFFYILLLNLETMTDSYIWHAHFNSTTWWVSLLVDQRVPEGTWSQILRSTSVDSKRFQSFKNFLVEIYCNYNFVGKWRIHLCRSLFWYFNHLVIVTAARPESPPPRAHEAKSADFSWLVAFWEHSHFPCWKFIVTVILWVYYTIPFGSVCFGTFVISLFNFSNYFVWLRITDYGSVPEMRIWSILVVL